MEIFVEIILYWNKNNNRTITWLLEGIPSSIICARTEQGCKWCYKGHNYILMPLKSHVIIITLLSAIHKVKSLPQWAKWKHNKNLINSTNLFFASFQTPSIFCPHEVAIQFLSVSWLNRWFVFCFSIVLLADMNLQSCKMFMFQLSGAQVTWRWMPAWSHSSSCTWSECTAFLCFHFSEELL